MGAYLSKDGVVDIAVALLIEVQHLLAAAGGDASSTQIEHDLRDERHQGEPTY